MKLTRTIKFTDFVDTVIIVILSFINAKN